MISKLIEAKAVGCLYFHFTLSRCGIPSFFLLLVTANVSRWEKTTSELEETLQEKQQKERDVREDVDRLTQNFDAIKKDISEFKSQISDKVDCKKIVYN